MDKPGKAYLIFIKITKPQPEHAKISEVLQKISCSPVGQLFINQGIAFGFRSNLSVGQISGQFTEARVFLNDDSFVLVELGTEFLAFRADPARAWLSQNLE